MGIESTFENLRAASCDADIFCRTPGERQGTMIRTGARQSVAVPSCRAELSYESDQRLWTLEQQVLAACDPTSREMLRELFERIVIVADDSPIYWGRGGDVACRLVVRIQSSASFRFILTAYTAAFESLGIATRTIYGVDNEPISIDRLPPDSSSFAVLVGDSAFSCGEGHDGYFGCGMPMRYDGDAWHHMIESFPVVHVREVDGDGLIPEYCLLRDNVATGRCAIIWTTPNSFHDWCEIVDDRPGSTSKFDAWPRGRSATFVFARVE